MTFFNIEYRDIINYIIYLFNFNDYYDIKNLCKFMLVNKFIYSLIYLKIEFLFNFYKNKDDFELLGHKEAIKLKDMCIIKYLESRYKSYNGIYKYMCSCLRKLIIKHQFYELFDYCKFDDFQKKFMLKNMIEYGYYDMFVKYNDLIKITPVGAIYDIIMSNDIRFFEYFNINKHSNYIDEYHLQYAITLNKLNSTKYLNNGNLIKYIKYVNSIEMLNYILNFHKLKIFNLSDNTILEILCKNIDNDKLFDYIILLFGIKNIDIYQLIITLGYYYNWFDTHNLHIYAKNIYTIIKKLENKLNIQYQLIINIIKRIYNIDEEIILYHHQISENSNNMYSLELSELYTLNEYKISGYHCIEEVD